jgi:hypothetical protein
MVRVPTGFNFGLAAAILAYNRRSEWLTAVSRQFFGALAEHFVDDYGFVDIPSARGRENTEWRSCSACARRIPGKQCPKVCLSRAFPWSSQGVTARLAALLGFPMAPSKHSPYAKKATYIGVESDFSDPERVLQRVKASTRRKAIDWIDQVLDDDRLAPGQAAKLVGKLQWCLLAGRIGRAALHPLRLRQYGQGATPWKLTREMARALRFLRAVVLDEKFSVSWNDRQGSSLPPVVILSDASWEQEVGELGWVASIPMADGSREEFFAGAKAPPALIAASRDLRDKDQMVCFLEAVAVAAVYESPQIASRIAGRDVLHWIDNTSALYSAVKGYSGAPDIARVVSMLQSRWLHLRIYPWLEFVKSEANLSDDPSRGRVADLLRAGMQRVPFVFPSPAQWQF